MGKKIPFPVTKGTLGNKIDDREISQEPEMQELTRLYEGMTEEERRRTQDYLEQHGEIPDNKKQEGTMKKGVTVKFLDVEMAKMAACVLRDSAIGTPDGSFVRMMHTASDCVVAGLHNMGVRWSTAGEDERV